MNVPVSCGGVTVHPGDFIIGDVNGVCVLRPQEAEKAMEQALKKRKLQEAVGVETRSVVPGHIQRGGTPSAFDRVLSTEFGVHAAELIRDEIYGVTVALKGNDIIHNPLSEVAGVAKPVPPDHHMVVTAKNIGICFGD